MAELAWLDEMGVLSARVDWKHGLVRAVFRLPEPVQPGERELLAARALQWAGRLDWMARAMAD